MNNRALRLSWLLSRCFSGEPVQLPVCRQAGLFSLNTLGCAQFQALSAARQVCGSGRKFDLAVRRETQFVESKIFP